MTIAIGLEILSMEDPQQLLCAAKESGFDFGQSPLLPLSASASLMMMMEDDQKRATPMLSMDISQLLITEADEARNLFCGLAPWTDLDSSDTDIRVKSQDLLRLQGQWASHLAAKGVVIYLPTQGPLINFSKSLGELLGGFATGQVMIRVELDQHKSDGKESQWDRWNRVRCLCPESHKLTIELALDSPNIPSSSTLAKWAAEPVKAISLSESVFMKNKPGYPILDDQVQQFLWTHMVRNVSLVVSVASEISLQFTGGLKAFQSYLRHLEASQPAPKLIDKFAQGYHDYLQMPLQPLMDNLESATYEVFEMDPVKYNAYEEAVRQALLDKKPRAGKVVVAVVGAGRGPIVDRVLRAAESAGQEIRLFAVEKNPNAILTLRMKKDMQWGDSVEVVHADLRFWRPEEKVDILVSELLGSFGDNELSPECLDGVQRVLSEEGISIPSSYTSYISPLFSPKLHRSVVAYNELKHLETPFVVHFRQAQVLCEPKPLWKFQHPNKNVPSADEPFFSNTHNERYSTAEFIIPENTLVHGLAGYFEATLYKTTKLSINPATHSPDMTSWFSIYFPIRSPVYVPGNGKVEVSFWRCTDQRKVWYEWSLLNSGSLGADGSSVIHNPGGRSYWIGL